MSLAYLGLVAVWAFDAQRRLERLIEAIRAEDERLWEVLGRPLRWRDAATWEGRAKFNRLRTDDAYAAQFHPPLVARIRELQRQLRSGLLWMALGGCGVLYLAWPLMR